MSGQGSLFGPADDDLADPRWPEGLRLRHGFVGATEEAALLREFDALPLTAARYRGYTARRRVVAFGPPLPDDDGPVRLESDDHPLPPTLRALRDRAAAWSDLDADALAHTLVTQYLPGTPLGWHRDMPHFGLVIGVSLGGPATMRLRPWPADRAARTIIELPLEPRSAYRLSGAARWGWQHAIAPTPGQRWSVTFRTLREPR